MNKSGNGTYEYQLPITMATTSYSVFGTYLVDAEGGYYTHAFKVRSRTTSKIKVYQNIDSSIFVIGF